MDPATKMRYTLHPQHALAPGPGPGMKTTSPSLSLGTRRSCSWLAGWLAPLVCLCPPARSMYTQGRGPDVLYSEWVTKCTHALPWSHAAPMARVTRKRRAVTLFLFFSITPSLTTFVVRPSCLVPVPPPSGCSSQVLFVNFASITCLEVLQRNSFLEARGTHHI